MRTVIRHGDRFGESFRLIVDAARPNWVDVPPVALALRVLEWIAIDFAGRREKEAGVLCFRDAERVVRSQRPDLQRLDRQLEIVDRARRRSKMKYALE